jgi:hypothetical protein
MPLSRKRGRDNFKQLVKDCTCPTTVLTKQRIEKFASRARAHICTYHHLDQQQKQAASEADPNSTTVAGSVSPVAAIPPHKKQELLFTEIEKADESLQGAQVCS